MRLNDIILFIVVFGSMALAVYVPSMGKVFQPYLVYFMMSLLFLSFIRIDFKALLDTSATAAVRLAILAFIKLVALPAALYGLTLMLAPEYAVPVLLLSGISTGVVAPFIGSLIDADIARILRMVIVTSLIVPFSLPVLVKILAGAEMTIPVGVMIRLLAFVIFVPIAAVALLRRFAPRVLEEVGRRAFPLSLTFFALCNLGVFSKYSSFFFEYPGKLVFCVALAYALSVVYYGTGFLVTVGKPMSERLAAGVGLGVMNNVLVIVFSSEFFGPLSPTLAAMYMFPFYTMIVPVKLIANYLSDPAETTARSPGGSD